MKYVVHKFDLNHGLNVIPTPAGFHALSVGVQHGSLKLWALVGTGEPRYPREILVVFTGEPHDALNNCLHIGTVTSEYGLVLHVFEVFP